MLAENILTFTATRRKVFKSKFYRGANLKKYFGTEYSNKRKNKK